MSAVISGTDGSLGDLGDLYRVLSSRLERIVRRGVTLPDPVIEDACQVAWGRLVAHGHRVHRETALGWLAKTAVHEALRVARQRTREVSLEETLEERGDTGAFASLAPGPGELCEQHEQLGAIAALSIRQQRLLWLRGLGLSYPEMARHESCTTRTVQRQLALARESARSATR
jgi:DNA-directed RNA polymerase specialized sigma24 family protein